MNTASIAEKKLLVRVALGEESADTVLLGGVVVNVHTLETYPADIAIKNGRIVFVGDVSHTIGPNTAKVSLEGKYLVPGFIETHMHVGGSQLNMTEFGKLALAHGTTSIATDMYEIGIINGVPGIRYFLEELRQPGSSPCSSCRCRRTTRMSLSGTSGPSQRRRRWKSFFGRTVTG